LNLEHQGYAVRLTSEFSVIEYSQFDQRWMLVNNYTSVNGVTRSIPPEDFERYIMLIDKDGIYRSYRPLKVLINMNYTRLRAGVIAYSGGIGKGMYLVTDGGGELKARRISNQFYDAASSDSTGCLLATSVRVAVNGLSEQRGESKIEIYDFCNK